MGWVLSEDCEWHVGERIGYDGDGGSHAGEITDVEPSGTDIQNGETGESIAGVVLRIRCDSCEDAPHRFTTPTVPERQWGHLAGHCQDDGRETT